MRKELAIRFFKRKEGRCRDLYKHGVGDNRILNKEKMLECCEITRPARSLAGIHDNGSSLHCSAETHQRETLR